MKEAITKIIEQIKKIQTRIEQLEVKGIDTSALSEKVEELNDKINDKINLDLDFGSWD